ncbi:MAG: DUF3592 domain-containing protein [Erythrobacter sp.]
MSKVILWVGVFFLPFGLLFAGIGTWSYWSDRDLAATGSTTQGTVIAMERSRDSDGNNTYSPTVEFFDPQGTRHQFTSKVSSSPPSFSRGEAVTVIFDPDAPGKAIIDSFSTRYLLPLIFGGMGSLFALIGAGLIGAYWRRRRIIANLRSTGMPIKAKFVECYRDTSTKINGRSPYRVVGQASHPATGRLQSFKSGPIWLDLTEQLASRDMVVLVDPTRPKRYFVDLSEWVDEVERA